MENDPLVTEEQEEQRVPEIDMSFFKDENINDMSAPSVPEVQAQELDTAQSPPPDPSSSAAGDTSPTTEKPKDDMIHKGIAKRSFTRKFTLADDIEIKDAKLKNGLLEIELEQIVPEHKKPRTINIK